MLGRRRGKWLLSLVLAAGVAIAAGLLVVQRSSGATSAQLEWDAVRRGDLAETVTATGSLEALQTVNVGTQISGTITRVYVDFNSRVKRGQLLALIDPDVLDAALTQARADLARARADWEDARKQLDEGRPLAQNGYLSSRDLRTLELRQQTTFSQVNSAQAAFERAQRNRQYAEIRSPIDGVVMQRSVESGQTVAASFQTPTLFTIAEDLARLKIVANVDESVIGQVAVGQKAAFTVSAFPERNFSAVVRQIRMQPTVSQTVVTYAVVLDAANSGGVLMPGMTATIDFKVKNLQNALLVPSAALRVQPPEELIDMPQGKSNAGGAVRFNGTQAGEMRVPEGMRVSGGARAPQGMGGGGYQFFAGPTGPQRPQAGGFHIDRIWIRSGEGHVRPVPVRLLGSNFTSTAVEPMLGKLDEGEQVLVRVESSSSGQPAAPKGPRGLLSQPQFFGNIPVQGR